MALSKEERDKRFKRGQQSARETIAAKEIFSLRLPPATIIRIYEIAAGRNIHASDLVRGWIEKCIESNEFQSAQALGQIGQNLDVVAEIREAIRAEFDQLSAKLANRQRHEALGAEGSKKTGFKELKTGVSRSAADPSMKIEDMNGIEFQKIEKSDSMIARELE